jgi:hypothetical protein
MNQSTSSFVFVVVTTAGIVLGGQPLWAQTNRVVITPPPPVLKSPVDSFRALLVMPTAERRRFLATRNTNAQERLAQKINEYRLLTTEQRELRLTATELRWYLQPLLRSPATNRTAQLALIPENLRDMVASRLEQWDRIPAPVQQMFLTNEQAAGYLARVEAATNFPPPPPAPLRQRMTARINQLFDLTPGEKEKVLATLSVAERQQMEKTLEAFQKLSPDQRRQCLISFKQFAEMTPAERQDFLKNAERWSQMTPAERQSWRELVSAAPNLPPLPNLRVATPPLPFPVRKPGPAVATNGG